LSMADSFLHVNLKAVANNYKILSHHAGKAKAGAVLKANGYGLGAVEIAKALWQEGCRTFFVATFEEAVTLADALTPEFPARIVLLGGRTPETDDEIWDYALIPVLNRLEDLKAWKDTCTRKEGASEAFLHVDTGMNRLGLTLKEFNALCTDHPSLIKEACISTVMSHLACADEISHPLNTTQHQRFEYVRRCVPSLKGSLAATGGVLLGASYCHDLVRLGIGLYGGWSFEGMQHVFHWTGRILQLRSAEEGEGVGYGEAWKAPKPSRIATVGIGYADGLPRLQGQPVFATLAGYKVPLVGRVSMDLSAFDVSNVPEAVLEQAETLTLLDTSEALFSVADGAKTISYEILTGIAPRSPRLYSETP
jgi:alanine racemase